MYDTAHNFIGIVDSVNTDLSISLKEVARLSLVTESYRISKDPTLFVDFGQKKIGVKNTLPEYDLDLNGTFKSSGNSIIGNDVGTKVVIGDEAALSGLGSSEKLYVDGGSKINGVLEVGSTNNISNPSISFSGNSKYGLSSNSNDSTLSVTGSSGELQRYSFDETNIFRTVKITNKQISETLKTSGSGYTYGSYVFVPLQGGSGSGLLVDVDITFDLNVSDPGVGYTAATYPSVSLDGGTGSGALAEVVISSGNVSDNISITNAGLEYETTPSISFVGDGQNAVAVANLSDSAIVKRLVVNSSGSGFTSATVVIGTEWTSSNRVNL